jgi:WD40 repeat protein
MLDRCLFKRRKIYLSGGDNTAKLWTADGTPIRTLKGHKCTIYQASFSK